MKAEEARKMTDDALARLAEALEKGKSEALTRYLSVMARFHRYSFGNLMLILSQSPEATHVAGFHTWKGLGRWVKKGEKGITIIAPMILKSRDEESRLKGDAKPIVRFKAVSVFDISQTDGEPLPEAAASSGDPGVYTDRLKNFIASRGIKLTHDPVPPGALGCSKGGEIRILPDLPAPQAFEVLVHELGHEMLHQGENGQRGSKAVVETEAEAVAFVVCHSIGLTTGTAASDYIQLHQGSKELLAQSLDRIQKTANTILEAITDPLVLDERSYLLGIAWSSLQFLPQGFLLLDGDSRESLHDRQADPALPEGGCHDIGQARQLHPLANVCHAHSEPLRDRGKTPIDSYSSQMGKGCGLIQGMHGFADEALRKAHCRRGIRINSLADAVYCCVLATVNFPQSGEASAAGNDPVLSLLLRSH